MRIVLLSDREWQGGAAVIAARLAAGFLAAGHDVTRVLGLPQGGRHAWKTVTLRPKRPLLRMIEARLTPARWRGRRARTLAQERLDETLRDLKPDVINVHNLHGAAAFGFSPALVAVCAAHAPTAWTLHDMWSFTGRCAHARDCRRFVDGCDASCPTPDEYPQLAPEHIAPAWEDRRRLFASAPALAGIAPSRWLAQQAKDGLWRGHRLEVIPNGLDLGVFEPLDRAESRRALGVRAEEPVLLVVAAWLDDPAKGGAALMDAFARMNRRPVTLLTVGEGTVKIAREGVRLHSLGRVEHPRMLAQAYSAADVFVHPSPAENLPNVIVEAMACGTPTVAFPVGGVPELVRPGVTGWLADEVSPAALARALETALQSLANGMDLRSSCRSVAEAEYGIDLQVGRYLELFTSLRDGAAAPHRA
jgi:glycosyltransferase involved in cell wall biosynthesis